MIRLGIVDFDTSHVVQFTMRLNHVEIDEEQWVDGAQVVMGCPGTSAILEQERIDEYTEKLRGFGVELVDRPEDMIGKIDGVLIESVDGSVHRDRALPFLEAGIPTWVDKPFTCSLEHARELADLAAAKGVPLFSSSSLRYGLEVVETVSDEKIGDIVGAEAYSPASLHPRNPGLFHYGIHAVEPLYALMGPGCEAVWCVFTEGAEVVTGLWKDGRIGCVRGTRAGAHAYGFTAWGEKGVRQSSINAAYIYRELLKKIVETFQTGKSPVDIAETVEIVAFIEAALKSKERGGEKVALA
ncbi:MAG: Gfo/Idh/MocA family protein [Armatimonadota bacterium]